MPNDSNALEDDDFGAEMVRKQDVVEAVNYLIHNKDSTTRIKELEDILDRWEDRPMIYAGHLIPLNALIDIGLEDREAFNRLIQLVYERRKLVPMLKRVDYQRELMRERRARLAKAVELQELRHGKMDKKTKARFQKEIQERWREAQEQFLRRKGRLSWAERNEARAEFWQMIDKNLDENIRAEREKKLRKR